MALATEGLTTHILNNHMKSALLLAGFPLLLLAMLGAFFLGLDMMTSPPGVPGDWDHGRQAALAGIAAYGPWVILGTGLWFTAAFFFHGSIMRAATHAIPVTRQEMPEIYNMLENLCISRGIPMPQFEVIDSPALNAFATGLGPKSYKIVLTRGIIDRLQPEELEGVIAHELTHIVNKDCRLLVIAVVFVGIISFMAHLLFRALSHGFYPNHYSRSRDRQGGGGAIAILLLALAILCIGYLIALMIRFSLSRRREYLADAGAITLTKNPEAMMRALQRISGQDRVAGLPDEVEQMCIENNHAFLGVFATHPPIEARIAAISRLTGTPVPQPNVSLRRGPRRPWDVESLRQSGGPWS
jgi:heat shock protein HtpX